MFTNKPTLQCLVRSAQATPTNKATALERQHLSNALVSKHRSRRCINVDGGRSQGQDRKRSNVNAKENKIKQICEPVSLGRPIHDFWQIRHCSFSIRGQRKKIDKN